MLELKISCDDLDQARVYLNAEQYKNLIDDLYNALRSARKHGSDADVLKVVEDFYPNLCHALDNSAGAY
jgi:hypothetical protein